MCLTLSGLGSVALLSPESELQLCNQVTFRAGFCQGSVQLFPDCFHLIQIVVITSLDEAWSNAEPFFLTCLQYCSTGVCEVGGDGVCNTALHLLAELPELSKCCVSVESVTKAFPLPVFASLVTLLNTSVFSFICLSATVCTNTHLSVYAAWISLFYQGG